jgi:RNA polymerase sigma factor (sigma-70 family)
MAKKMQPPQVEERFNAVIEEFGQFLRQSIARLCPQDRGIQFDDIEQEARLRLWRALRSETEIQNLASYIYRIAATATIDAVRRAKVRREEQLHLIDEEEGEGERRPLTEDREKSPVRLTEQRQVIQKVNEALARLPESRRRAVGLHLEGMTSREIADLMGWSEPKARNLIYRGLKDLRSLLQPEGIEYEID